MAKSLLDNNFFEEKNIEEVKSECRLCKKLFPSSLFSEELKLCRDDFLKESESHYIKRLNVIKEIETDLLPKARNSIFSINHYLQKGDLDLISINKYNMDKVNFESMEAKLLIDLEAHKKYNDIDLKSIETFCKKNNWEISLFFKNKGEKNA